ncbi:hypothetical protein [Limnochorda pilosa]|uniref:Antitoxin SocA-like Panacea domain-containing protein n=1 Tax=Limnochorda pilosa TaxID=1555112 RepID=A0A0K2SLI9_LIMPI|nr:hypothetical protein [Limnochorda pilosa]BAS27991.1 hypothetical protein LIP_2150 [Limnochorda pilosa]
MVAGLVQERRSFVVALIQELNDGGSWSGSTHVQKCSFFIQHLCGLPMGYSFVIYHYGPYSFDLEEELAIMRWQGLVKVEPDPGGYGVHYQVGAAFPGGGPEISDEHRQVIHRAVGHLGQRHVRDLELLATTYYLQKGLDGKERDEPSTVEAVLALKPHFNEAEVGVALRELAELEAALGAGQ